MNKNELTEDQEAKVKAAADLCKEDLEAFRSRVILRMWDLPFGEALTKVSYSCVTPDPEPVDVMELTPEQFNSLTKDVTGNAAIPTFIKDPLASIKRMFRISK